MLEAKDLFSIPYYSKGAVFTGSQRDFRFRIEGVFPEEGEKALKITFYPDKVCWEMTPDEEKEEMVFEYSPVGLEQIAEEINGRNT